MLDQDATAVELAKHGVAVSANILARLRASGDASEQTAAFSPKELLLGAITDARVLSKEADRQGTGFLFCPRTPCIQHSCL